MNPLSPCINKRPNRIPVEASATFAGLSGFYIGNGNEPSKFATIPPISTGEVDADGVAECHMPQNVIDYVLATPGFPQPIKRPDATCIRESEYGGGLGMFATRDIQAGELVLAERPMMLKPRSLEIVFQFPDHPPVEQIPLVMERAFIAAVQKSNELLLEHSFGRMSEQNQAAFMALKPKSPQAAEEGGQLFSRVSNNAYGVEIGQRKAKTSGGGNAFTATFKEMSRMNHSCGPNCNYDFDVQSFSMQLYALRDIAQDEEITVPYIDIRKPHRQRANDLAYYGFVCRCPHCTDKQSDSRRARLRVADDKVVIGQLPPRFMTWLTDLSLPDDHILPSLHRLLSNIETEGLQSLLIYGETLMQICATHNANGAKAEYTEALERVRRFMSSRAQSREPEVWRRLLQEVVVPLEGVRARARAQCGSEGRFQLKDYVKGATVEGSENDVADVLGGLNMNA